MSEGIRWAAFCCVPGLVLPALFSGCRSPQESAPESEPPTLDAKTEAEATSTAEQSAQGSSVTREGRPAAASESPESARLVVVVRVPEAGEPECEIVCEGRVHDRESLTELLAARVKRALEEAAARGEQPQRASDGRVLTELELRIRAERGAPAGCLRAIFDAAEDVGIYRITVTTIDGSAFDGSAGTADPTEEGASGTDRLNVSFPSAGVTVAIDREKASELGVSVAAISKALRQFLEERPAAKVEELASILVFRPDGTAVPLAQVARIEAAPGTEPR